MEVSKTPTQQDESYPTVAALRADYVWWVVIGVTVVMVAAIYQKALLQCWNQWWVKDSRYSHGVLVPFISLFAVYADRKKLSAIPLRPNIWIGALALLFVIVLALVSWTGGSTRMEAFTFPLFLLAAVLMLAGLHMARALLFPILFLSFMCPLPGFILNATDVQIQIWSTEVAVKILRPWFDVINEGTIIKMPNITVTVAEACSGFRMLISIFAFSTFFALMKEGRWWNRMLTVASALPLALVANSLRITLIAWVGESYGEKAMHSFHDWSGYIMLVVSFVALEFLSRLMGCRKFKSAQ